MIKVAMIGAGSVVFSRNLTGDILSYPEFANATLSYMDIDRDRLQVGAALCTKAAKALGAKPRIQTTTSRRKALEGADFVINMVQIGGFDSTLVDFEIPRKYGLAFTIADTTGPGGLFRALRTYPMLKGLCQDMHDVCPKAVLLNYSNPMSMNMQTVFRTGGIAAVGLCHSVQGTFNQLMWYLGEDREKVAFTCAGINHMAFFLSIRKNGVDLYPRLFKAMENPDVYDSNRVRFELMKRLGYFVTESSEHNAEYNPWFIPRGPESVRQYRIPLDEYLRRCDANTHEFGRMKAFAASREPARVRRSHEYGSQIIHSMATGTPRVIYGNLPNNGAITNLPASAVVEVPTLVDRAGLHATTIGDLPPQLVGYVMPHVLQHELFIRAATEGRRECVYQAAMNDPLTSATLPLDRIVQMCDELIAAHGSLLPKLRPHPLIPGSGKTFKPVSTAQLQRRWEDRKKRDLQDFITEWHVIGPFAARKRSGSILGETTSVESALAADGSVDLSARHGQGARTASWQKLGANEQGHVILDKHYGKIEWANAYAYAEVNSGKESEVLLCCGSDDGIRIWVNGVVVHEFEEDRALHSDDDMVPVRLVAGRNRILVKVANHRGGWGFCVALRNLS